MSAGEGSPGWRAGRYVTDPRRRPWWLVVGLAVSLALPQAAGGATQRVELGAGLVAALTDDDELFLEALPRPGEGLIAFARRLTGGDTTAEEIAAANGRPKRLLAGVRYRVPYSLLLADLKLDMVRRIFAEDRGLPGGWEHHPTTTGAGGGKSLWRIAEWFTGSGENYLRIREASGLDDNEVTAGASVLIPADLLLPVFRALLPTSPYPLEYGSDAQGEFAAYRLQAGEALYSSVVVRFTGRVFAEDVNGLATEIAQRSGIVDVTDIPVGYAVKIPLDLLQAEFLPAGHPRRREYEESLLASQRYSNPVQAAYLDGITVILDAGHGGADVGAMVGNAWESLYVYDIMLRVRELLETSTAARVVPTTQDGKEFRIPDADVLPYSRGHRVLTSPPYPIADSTVGVHLRWYLANSVFRQAVSKSGDPDKVVFVSIHADSLHSSLRGAMVYVPGASYRDTSYGKTGAVYASRQEVRESPRVSFTQRDLVRSEGLSRQLAERVIDALGERGLAIHPFKPVREKVVRKRRSWVPAVLRYNAVPAQILVEVCNLANLEDRRLVETRRFRQQMAEAIVAGILDYYGRPGDGRAVVTAGG